MIFRSRRPLAARNWVHEPISSPRESEMYEPPIGPGASRPEMIGTSEEAPLRDSQLSAVLNNGSSGLYDNIENETEPRRFRGGGFLEPNLARPTRYGGR